MLLLEATRDLAGRPGREGGEALFSTRLLGLNGK